jgi:hypothetical protein
MKKITLSLLTGIICLTMLSACSEVEKTSSTYYLVTRLGADTLAIEKVIKHEDSIEAQVILRSPSLREAEYGFSLNPESAVLMRGVIRNGSSGELVTTQIAEWDEDSLLVTIGAGDRQRKVSNDPLILPFIDMVHWPFDLMLQNANVLAVGETMEQPLWSGTRAFSFEIKRITSDSMTLKHPSRGTMGVETTAEGQLQLLDARQTTRKLTVTRVGSLDYEALKARYVKLEESGKSFGALSGRGKTEKTVSGVNYLIDFGTPEKRGREIWGGIVKYGERWRTGANRATHFKIDRDIMLGKLTVPAGEYTLFSIPQENYLSLIVNKQTGQNGQSYDSSQDLGVVDLQALAINEVVEVFTIDIVEKDGKVYLSLQWDDKAYEVEIEPTT